ncbi:hypothetical protein ACIOC1_34005 [Streptomyces sp. NPDC088197]|uniref:hypothetical protein n=1 Tax=unclassified Streptomyces TaxID=2593676 RepID=UPI0036E875F9
MTGTATASEQETLMPYLVPPRTPLTPEQVHRAFAYLMALEAGGGGGVAGREEADPELPFLMLRLTEDLVLPVTTVPDDEDPTADSFILERVGDVLLSALRDWQRDSPTTGCIGLARTLLRFITGLLTDQDDHGDVHATLEQLRDEHPALGARTAA